MPGQATTQREQLRSLTAGRALLRAQELREAGIAGSTIQRALRHGDLVRIGRGLYQDPNAEIDGDLTYAEVAKRIPKGVIAMVSALAFHGLTDQMPRSTWVAIRAGDWSPVPGYPPVRIVRFSPKYQGEGIEHHGVAGVDVAIYRSRWKACVRRSNSVKPRLRKSQKPHKRVAQGGPCGPILRP